MSLVDLEEIPTASIVGPSDVLHFYLPRSALTVAANQEETRPITRLNIDGGTDDSTVYRLGRLMLPVLRNPNEANRLFLTGLTTALHGHLLQNYGAGSTTGHTVSTSLTPAQLSRAKERIRADLTGDFPLAELAAECQLPASYFARAFERSTGMGPHEWLLLQRVERAKHFLTLPNIDMQSIAFQCGFADYSHMERVFSAVVGVSPFVWALSKARARTSRKPH
ncbi:AraC family transcriptional regulator [Caballeronia sp. GAFFF1]|uniref:helix-turn-helix domain-containing protein n=1 Tax=Caballeronia sp. GAFFF1 TaxID=2921779 RepID=UPI002027AAFA|nr:AraC family transcriptional regulator [Caballeronia sp. GAFFF1]